MWQTAITTIEKDKIFKYEILKEEQYLTFQDFLQELRGNVRFRIYFNQLLADVPFEAFFWECRAVNKATINQDFEFVVVQNSTLASIRESKLPFNSYFKGKNRVVSFMNLRGDAYLVVPTPQSEDCYAHLANFVRKAPSRQQDAFWQVVGKECEARLGKSKHWWSTSGLGVYWLHLRIDNFPKYYQYSPYRKEARKS